MTNRPAPWQGLRNFTVTRKQAESSAITSFELTPQEGGLLPEYRAGQYLPIDLDIPGQRRPVGRTYTLSGDPAEGRFYRLSIKREAAPDPATPAGLASGFLHDQVAVGAVIRARAPQGDFYIDLEAGRPVALVSAGVGLTPMVAMLHALVARQPQRPVLFLHGARNNAERALAAEVKALVAKGAPAAKAHILYSQPAAGDRAGIDYDERGRIDAGTVRRLLAGPDADIYLCGPAPFLRELYAGLQAAGVPKARLHYEFFGPAEDLGGEAKPTATAPAAALATAEPGPDVIFEQRQERFAWEPRFANLLDFAEAKGLNPDNSCRSGLCHTCATPILEGEVEYVEAPADPPPPGQVLICCSRPKGRVVLDL